MKEDTYDPEGGAPSDAWKEGSREITQKSVIGDQYDPEGGAYNPEGGAYDPQGGANEEEGRYEPESDPAAPAELDSGSYAPSTVQESSRYPDQEIEELVEEEEPQASYEPSVPASAALVDRTPPAQDPYAPSSYAPSPYDAYEPAKPSTHQDNRDVYDPYAPVSSGPKASPPEHPAQRGTGSGHEPYAPSAYAPSSYEPGAYDAPSQQSRPPVKSPAQHSQVNGLGLHSMGSPRSESRPIPNAYNPYALAAPSSVSQGAYEPYGGDSYKHSQDRGMTPSQSDLLTPGDMYSRGGAPLGSSYGSDRTISPQPGYFQNMQATTEYVPQQVLEQRPVSEDPLGRCTLAARNAPLAVFGFGGALITAFPALADDDSQFGHSRTPSYGYASGRGQLWIRSVSQLVSTSALFPNNTEFPGPLILDPKTPKGAAGSKKKREAVLAYLEARAEEIEKGLPYLKSSASSARTEEEGKLVLVRLLKALVLGDGKLSKR